MQDLLKEYNTLFQEPTKLPPRREIDHNITLKEGTEPVNVRPYCYAYFQKAEIEKQAQEMLNSGLIRPSTSPFSSPVLLVKKKMEVGDFVPTIGLSITPLLKTDFQSLQSMTCWTSYMEQRTSLNWT